MSEPVEPKFTVDDLLRNSRPIPTAIIDRIQRTLYRNSAAAEAKGRERLAWVASLFVLARHDRRRLDPRRLGDRFVERACRRWIARSEAAGGTMPVEGGGVVYEVRLEPEAERVEITIEGRAAGEVDRRLAAFTDVPAVAGIQKRPDLR